MAYIHPECLHTSAALRMLPCKIFTSLLLSCGNGHRGDCPWWPRLSDAVFMMPKNDWFCGVGKWALTRSGKSCHTWEKKTLAACEILVNRVTRKVMIRCHLSHCHWVFRVVLYRLNVELYGWICSLFEKSMNVCLALNNNNKITDLPQKSKKWNYIEIHPAHIPEQQMSCYQTFSSLTYV